MGFIIMIEKNNSQFILYQAEDGQTKIEVRLEDETVWLTQKHMAELFQVAKSTISEHVKQADSNTKCNTMTK